MSFTMPEGLGRWRFLGFAHDAAMRCGSLEGETVTAKDLMVQPNPPRFLREGDVLDFTVRLSNQSDTGTDWRRAPFPGRRGHRTRIERRRWGSPPRAAIPTSRPNNRGPWCGG